MFNFKNFLVEAASSEERLSHLEHAEDHVINSGEQGFAHAFHSLEDTHDLLSGKKNDTTVMTKYDGSPSIVFGRHPETGKFFVASKSAWNVNPKVNYTDEDINNNHGHAPGLAEKLKLALKHLPKVTPKTGVYQGDLMHSGVQSPSNPQGDVEHDGKKLHFQANPSGIKYSTPHDSEEGEKIKNSKIGVVVHTAYHGPTFESMKVDYAPDLSTFKDHPDVHRINNREDIKTAKITPQQSASYKNHMQAATELFKNTPPQAYKSIEGHTEHLKTYINKTVREDSTPTVEGYQAHLKERHTKEISKVKSEKAIGEKTAKMNQDLAEVDNNKDHFKNVFGMHNHLQKAKDELVHAMGATQKFEHTMGGQKTKPEGYVVVKNNRPTKLVDRAEFSKMNLLGRAR